MGRNARKEAIVKLREEIEVCNNDPKLLMQLTRRLERLLPKKKAATGRPRNETPTRKTLAKDAAAEDAKSTHIRSGSALDNMPLGEQTLNRLVIALEAEDKRRGFAALPAMTRAEEVVFKESIVAGFTDTERAALDALGSE